MKKVLTAVFVALTVFIFASCGEADPKPASHGEDSEVSDDEGENQAAEDGETQNDSEVVPETDNEPTAGDDEPAVIDDDPNTEEPDENNEPVNPGFEVIGTFNLSYTGQINMEVNMQSRGGEGSADFVYNGQAISFGKINIASINLFPMTMVNSGNIVIVWLDGFELGDLQGTSN